MHLHVLIQSIALMEEGKTWACILNNLNSKYSKSALYSLYMRKDFLCLTCDKRGR